MTVAAETPAVDLRGVSKSFGESVAVHPIDLQLADGEFFALLGPSGCGKTTTLRMIGGFELPSSGRIYLHGNDVTTLPSYRRDVNTVFQSYALFPHLTVFDNVAFGLRKRKVKTVDIRRRVEHHLEMVGLAGYGKRRPAQLSGGQQQRVALARALVNQPKVLLLDEPMGALDAKIRKSMQLELKRIQTEVGITFLYVTHDQAEAMSMADRLAVMNTGRCEDIGAPDRVYDQPASRFVAEFLGTCNVLPTNVDAGVLRLPDGTAVEIAAGESSVASASTLGIRPEKLVITRPPSATDSTTVANRIRGQVISAVYLGASTDYEVRPAWGGVVRASAQNIGDDSRFSVGELVELSWDAQNCFSLPGPTTNELSEPTHTPAEKVA